MKKLFLMLCLFGVTTCAPLASEPKALKVDFIKDKLPARPLRVVLLGDSITWGGGLLDTGFTGVVDRYLREELATTIMPDKMKMTGRTNVVQNPKLYRSTATAITGEGASAEFELFGDELSLCIVRERGNQAAAEVEVFADGDLIGRFNTLNHEAFGHDRKVFTGDGKKVQFDLGRCFTYGHKVRVNGKELIGGLALTGRMNNDYVIFRKYHYPNTSDKPDIHHFLWLDKAPAEGASIEVDFDYGENVMYAKTTVTETAGLDSQLESAYGDDRISFDPTLPCNVNRGLDFRSSDERSVVTYKFKEPKKRRFKLVVGKNISGSSAESKLILNFASNRFHQIMNAGIGGWTASAFLSDRGLRSWREAMEFEPDIMFIGLGTNDDWNRGNQFVAYRTVEGIGEAEFRSIPTLWLRDFSPSGQSFDVNVNMLKIAEASKHNITIDPQNVHFEEMPQIGDVLIIGDYYGDNRTVATREIRKWNAENLSASFDEELKESDFFGLAKMSDLKGQSVRIKRTPAFMNDMTRLIGEIRSVKSDVIFGIVDTGYSNYRMRLLFGYPLRLKKLAHNTGSWHVNSYDYLEKWIFSRPLDTPVFLNSPGNQTASGVSEYKLVKADGKDPLDLPWGLFRHFSVKVDGVERFGKGCRIEGGASFGFKEDQNLREIEWKPWQILKNNVCLPAKLVFTSNPPAKGAKVEVKCSTKQWSHDDCHPNANGAEIYGTAIKDALKQMIKPTGS